MKQGEEKKRKKAERGAAQWNKIETNIAWYVCIKGTQMAKAYWTGREKTNARTNGRP